MLNWTRYPTTSPRPATARPAAKATSPSQIDYVACDPDSMPDRHIRVGAQAAALNAARELGLDKPPPIRWFEKATPAGMSYRKTYFPRTSFKSWQGPDGLMGQADRISQCVRSALCPTW